MTSHASVKVQHIVKVNGTKAMPILVRAWSYLLEHKLAPLNQWPLAWDMEALIAVTPQGIIVGVIGFAYQEWTRELVLNIGYVDLKFRKQGVYEHLWLALVKQAQKRKIPSITSGTAMNNYAVRTFSKKAGRKETRVLIDFIVPRVKQP